MMTALEVVQAFWGKGISDPDFQLWEQRHTLVYNALPFMMDDAGLYSSGDRELYGWTVRNPQKFFAWIRSCGLWSEEELADIDPYVVMALAEDAPSGG